MFSLTPPFALFLEFALDEILNLIHPLFLLVQEVHDDAHRGLLHPDDLHLVLQSVLHVAESQRRVDQNKQQGERDSEDEDQDAAEQREHKVAGDHDCQHKQSGVLPFEVLDDGLVLSGPNGPGEDQSHHRSAKKHAQWVQKAHNEENHNSCGEIIGLVIH